MIKLLIIAGFAGMVILTGSFSGHPGSSGMSADHYSDVFPSAGKYGDMPGARSSGTDTADPSFLVISDIHLHDENDQSPVVTRNSDSGKDLWDSTENKIRSVLSGEAGVAKPKFIIYLGDLPWHAKDSSQMHNVMGNAGKVLADLRILAEGADIPLLYVPGNNDSEDSDYAPFSNKLFLGDPAGNSSWPVIGGKRERSSGSFPKPPGSSPKSSGSSRKSSGSSTKEMAGSSSLEDTAVWNLGCYAAAPLKNSSKLLVLVLNTNVFTQRYGLITDSERQNADAEEEMEWLERQLRAAAATHRRVLIAMHVPPGKDGYLKAEAGRAICTGRFKDLWDPAVRVQKDGQPMLNPQNAFLDLVDAYQHSIVGIVGSHTHFDGIRVLKTRRADSISALLISVPGIAPGHGNNPGFKIIRYDPANFQLNDFITFYNNFYPTRTVRAWGGLSYSFREVFHAAPGVSMFDQVKGMPADSLRKYVNSIYTVYNGDGYSNGNCVDTTLYVHYLPWLRVDRR